jgi:hypothetical protein
MSLENVIQEVQKEIRRDDGNFITILARHAEKPLIYRNNAVFCTFVEYVGKGFRA